MPCVICGRDSAGSDICSRCEEIERDRLRDEERDRFADEECQDDMELDEGGSEEGS